jgi:cysteine-rich repeat protein
MSCGGSGIGTEDGHGEADAGFDDAASDGSDGRDGPDGDTDAGPRPQPLCGNGIVDPGEECDDGNRLDGDECDWLCRTGPGDPPDETPDPDFDDVDRLTPAVDGRLVADGWGLGFPPRLPLVWADDFYATVWFAPRDADRETETAKFVAFDVEGRPVGPGWTYVYSETPFHELDLVWAGDRFGLAWCSASVEGDLLFVEVDREGKPMFSPVVLADGVGPCTPRLLRNGDRYLVVWTTECDGHACVAEEQGVRALLYRRFETDVPAPGTIVMSAPETWSMVCTAAAGGARFLVACQESGPACAAPADLPCSRYAILDGEARPSFTSWPVGPIAPMPPIALWVGDRFALVTSVGVIDHRLLFVDRDGRMVGPSRALAGCPVAMGCVSRIGLGAASDGRGLAVAIISGIGNSLLRIDRRGTMTGAVALDDSSGFGPTSYDATIAMVWDGEGFGLLLRGREGPLFWRAVVGP